MMTEVWTDGKTDRRKQPSSHDFPFVKVTHNKSKAHNSIPAALGLTITKISLVIIDRNVRF
jgi:hypothetical protein